MLFIFRLHRLFIAEKQNTNVTEITFAGPADFTRLIQTFVLTAEGEQAGIGDRSFTQVQDLQAG